MTPLTKVRRIAKQYGYKISSKTSSLGQSWTVAYADTGNPIGAIFDTSNALPDRLIREVTP